jgi:hypothetical protein
LQSIADVVKDMSFISRMGINLLAGQTKSEGLVAITAREFMFGYKNPLVTIGNTFMPSWIKFDKLGLIDRVSATCLGTEHCNSIIRSSRYAVSLMLVTVLSNWVHSARRPSNWPTVPSPGDFEEGEFSGMIGRGNRSTRRKPTPVPLYPS